MVERKLSSWLGYRYIQLTAYFSCQKAFYFPVPGYGNKMPVFWIKENRMFGTFAIKNTTFSYKMADEVTAFHRAILEPGFFS